MRNESTPSDVRRALIPFKRRLTAEAWLKSGLWALAAGCAAAVCMGILRLLVPGITRVWVALVPLVVCAVTAMLLFLLRFRPDDERTARRIDTLGMSDRVSTMYEYRNDTAPAVVRQRSDALHALNGVVPEELTFTLPKRAGLSAMVLCVAAVVLLLLPAAPARSVSGTEPDAETGTQAEGETLIESGIPADVIPTPSDANGEAGDGAAVNGNNSSHGGGNTDGGDPNDSAGTGNDVHGTPAMKESVYDPGQHTTLPYGDVYASYYITYEKTSDELPGRVNDAMRDYLDKLKERDRKEE